MVAVKGQLVDRRDALRRARARRSSTALASTRSRRQRCRTTSGACKAQQARITAALQAAAGSGGGNLAAGPIKPGSGGLIWPVNGPITSPFCESRAWESCHPGIDIGVPAGTPIRAAAAGQRRAHRRAWARRAATATSPASSTRRSMSTCYAHQSSFAVSMGQSVTQGQVIGYVGCTGPLLRPAPALRGPHQRLASSTR